MRIAAHTLGCKLNFAETTDHLRRLAAAGHTIVDFRAEADLYIINTCTVTAVAEKKCRTAIRQAHRLNPAAQIVVVGCFAQVAAAEIERIPGVTLVLGNDRKHLLPEIVESGYWPVVSAQWSVPSDQSADAQNTNTITPARPQGAALSTAESNQISEKSRNNAITNAITQSRNNAITNTFPLQYSSGNRTRVFFKIQDGCDYFCTYCAIPYARGRSRSATIEETLCMARRIADEGGREVVLTGVNTGTFGQHNGESFLDLLRGLDQIEGILRYRISSIEPNLLTDEIIDFVAQSRAFLPHFHIPLQAGSDHVLSLMRRRYDTALYASKLHRIKDVMPDACIAADVMAGFNGETEEEFQKVLRFIEGLPISYLHVFTYSDRPGTAALRLDEKVPVPVRHDHTHRLLGLSEQKHRAFIQSQLGKRRPVLWESKEVENAEPLSTLNSRRSTFMEGWTDNYIRLRRPYDTALVNTVTEAEVRLEDIVRE